MEHDVFDQPVRVLAGLGIPRDIETAFQAYTFLNELPYDRSKPNYLMTRRACWAAMDGGGDAQKARAAFAAFAERAGILAPEVEDIVAASAIGACSSHTPA